MLSIPISKWSYNCILYRSKRFEICKIRSKRDIGDRIRLREREDGQYTGRALVVTLMFEQKNPGTLDGVRQGYSVIGFDEIEEDDPQRDGKCIEK